MAHFRCCGNHSTAGHTVECPLKPPDYESPPVRTQSSSEREEQEQGCQFDILRFQHIGDCKGTCGEEPERAHYQDPTTLVIVVVEIDPDDEMAEQKLQELERRGLHRLTEDELAELVDRHERGEVQLRVETMTLNELEEQTRLPESDVPYLTIRECAELLGFSENWTRTLCRRGRFDGAIKLIHRWAIPKDAILEED
jgi:predicted DNA-binding transcriptional regulator AlpA